ncbi:MAG: hypothetical protein V1674_04390 [Candidatus Omnitrophota bacterium]
MTKRIIIASLLFRGILTIIAQVILIRELLITFLGNELSIGIILANWLFLEALGSSVFGRISQKIKNGTPQTNTKHPNIPASAEELSSSASSGYPPKLVTAESTEAKRGRCLAKVDKIFVFILLMVVIAAYLPIAVYLARTIKTILGIGIGEVAGIPIIFISSLTILSILTFCDGALFSLGCSIYSSLTKQVTNSITGVYILESLGFFTGGLFFSFLLIRYFGTFQIVLLVAITNLFLALLLSIKVSHRLQIGIILLLIAFGFLFLNSSYLQQISLNSQWKGLNILDYQNSVYGNVMVTKRVNEFTFFYDGIPLLTSPNPDTASLEDLAHFSLLSHPHPRQVLVIGAATGGLINEISKHPVNIIDYAELDPLIIKMIKKFPTNITLEELSNPKVDIHYLDGRLLVKKTKTNYDVIILNLPAPSNLQLNRFYTLEFFKEAKNALKNDGILVLRLPGSLSYLSQDLRQLNNCEYRMLKRVFKNTRVIPGDTNLYLASGDGLGDFGADTILKRFQQRNIKTRNISEFYIRDRLSSRWLDWFSSQIDQAKETKINSDLHTSALFYEISFLNAQFSPKLNSFFNRLQKTKFKFVTVVLILINLAVVLFKRFLRFKSLAFNFAIFSTGFMGMGINLILILAFQSFYGYLYYQIAFLISFFMIGLALGSLFISARTKNSKNDRKSIIKVELVIITFCIIVGLILFALNRSLNVEKLKYIFLILCALAGAMVGGEFLLVNKLRLVEDKSLSKVAGSVYAWDLLGSWLGALSISVVFIPLFGIIQTIALIALLKITSLNLITA